MNYGDVVGILATGGLLLVCSHAFDNSSIGFRKLTPWSGTYLDTLETSARVLELNLPYLGEFFKPNGELPGLCKWPITRRGHFSFG
jgi:hypothetical protein